MALAHLEKLNPQQRHAVEHGIGVRDTRPAGPLLVIAGAGSGKTNTLAHRVAHLIVNGADPRRILLMTFSRRASVEMARRVERITRNVLGGNGATTDALAWAGTFHGIGARLLRDYAEQIGLDPSFTIHDREDSADLMNLVRHALGFSKTETRFPTKGTCISIYSRCVNAEMPIDDVLHASFKWCAAWSKELKELFAGYVEAKQRQNVLDYDDLLLYWAQMVADPAIAEDIGGRFDHVLVDEYQDTNRLQASILLGLKRDGRGLTVVGDDAQAIYSFRAANVRNILDFPKHFDPPAEVVTLDRNYRSTQTILAAANGVIDLAAERFTKNLWSDRDAAERPRLVAVRDEADQARYIVERVLENREAGVPAEAPGRAVSRLASFGAARGGAGPAQHSVREVRRPQVSRCRARQGFAGPAALRREPARSRRRLSSFAADAGRRPDDGAARSRPHAREHASRSPRSREMPTPARVLEAEWAGFVETMLALHIGGAGWPAEIANARHWYDPHLERRHEDAAPRRADLVQLEQIAAGYPSRERFLTDLTLDPPDATSDEAGPPLQDEDYLILSTIHSAKGQEWKSVFVLNVVDGCIPSDLGTGTTAEIEEERRLLYVAMTRAKDDLHLVVPQRFFTHGQNAHGDRHVYASRTRFIPSTLLKHFEAASWPVARAGSGARVPAQDVRINVGAKMREMWR